MDITILKKLAVLSKLSFTEEDLEKYGKDMTEILDYVSLLNEVDTKDIEPTRQVSGNVYVAREDEQIENNPYRLPQESLLACSPQPKEMKQIKVPKVFE